MFLKQHRLDRKSFTEYFKCGARSHNQLVTMVRSPSPNDHSLFRVAVSVSKKVFKKAVDRNRLRRRLYAIMKRRHQEEPLSGIYILIAKPLSASATYEALEEAVTNLLKKG